MKCEETEKLEEKNNEKWKKLKNTKKIREKQKETKRNRKKK